MKSRQTKQQPKTSFEQVRKVYCFVCRAKPGEPCMSTVLAGAPEMSTMHHDGRKETADRFNIADPYSDRAFSQIVYYAFYRMSESVAVNSKAVLGREMNVGELQAFFLGEAVKELKKSGEID